MFHDANKIHVGHDLLHKAVQRRLVVVGELPGVHQRPSIVQLRKGLSQLVLADFLRLVETHFALVKKEFPKGFHAQLAVFVFAIPIEGKRRDTCSGPAGILILEKCPQEDVRVVSFRKGCCHPRRPEVGESSKSADGLGVPAVAPGGVGMGALGNRDSGAGGRRRSRVW